MKIVRYNYGSQLEYQLRDRIIAGFTAKFADVYAWALSKSTIRHVSSGGSFIHSSQIARFKGPKNVQNQLCHLISVRITYDEGNKMTEDRIVNFSLSGSAVLAMHPIFLCSLRDLSTTPDGLLSFKYRVGINLNSCSTIWVDLHSYHLNVAKMKSVMQPLCEDFSHKIHSKPSK